MVQRHFDTISLCNRGGLVCSVATYDQTGKFYVWKILKPGQTIEIKRGHPAAAIDHPRREREGASEQERAAAAFLQ